MEDRMEQRYLPEKPILPLASGMVYMGKDLSLNRKVILYAVDSQDDAFTKAYTEMLGEASQFTDRSFIHILDMGFNHSSNRLVAVLKPCNGTLLYEVIAGGMLSFQEKLTIVYKLALGMQKALEEGIVGFSISADNIWIDPEGHPVIMNYWEQGQAAQRGTKGLVGLLLQLIAGKSTGPVVTMDDPAAQEALRQIPGEQRDVLVSLIRQVAAEDVPLKLFIAQLARIVIVRGTREPVRAQEPEAVRRPVSAMTKSAPSFSEEPVQPRKQAAPPPPPEPDEEDEEEEDEPRRFTVGGMMKRLLLIGGAVVVIGVCSVLILMGLFEVLRPDKGYVPSAPATETSPPVADAKPTPSATPVPDKPKETPKPDNGAATDQGPTQVPNLIGMTQAEAEKAALAAGLRYSFVLEPNEMAQGKVFKQDLQPNATAERGSRVTFWISKGQ
ncbi:PASTA domain-containing protein [Paenibacillus sp. H1-7]|uniref:PASTA domain-containing protein n=1 Tax=Paenibacillus sp. H1-7 TaxID=2282849 RepID=UPI001EF8F1F9|nr:PASTA domain-containing protein [Paenibacillus sp. H1-7]ULL18460.1 PASTA domain-containing protein [Paenibacillus sp. H1-7]